MKIGVLTSGGDTPGMNAVIAGICRRLWKECHEVIGFYDGWLGLIENKFVELNLKDVVGIQAEGGTILGSSRRNPMKREEDIQGIKETIAKHNLEGLIAIGGDDTLGMALNLKNMGYPVVGVPKTIDNDLSSTDYTFGYDTAVSVATEAIDRLHTTARSHHRIIVVEVMGRHTGWIAWKAGLAARAHFIAIPEFKVSLDDIVTALKPRFEVERNYAIVVVAEGALIDGVLTPEEVENAPKDDFGNVLLAKLGVAKSLSKALEREIGQETRPVVLGHLQRGGPPTAFDRVLGIQLGTKAAKLILDKEFGKMASLQGTEMVSVPLEDAVQELKKVPESFYKVASLFFG